jgi:hypothetical protein
MKVENMESAKGNKIANQFVVKDDENNVEYFQSYDSVIVRKDLNTGCIWLDEKFWDYSVTTGKYRNIFLRETKKETMDNIKRGRYILTDLNER